MALVTPLSGVMLLEIFMAIQTAFTGCYLPDMPYMASPAVTMPLYAVKPKLTGLFMAFKAVLCGRLNPFVGVMTGVAIKLHRRITILWKWHIRVHILMT